MSITQMPKLKLVTDEAPNRQKVKRDISVDAHERDRDYLSASELEALLTSAKKGRFGSRDHTMLLIAFRHGLRVSELCALRKCDLDFDASRIWVKRLKDGLSTTQPLQGDEMRALRGYLRTRSDGLPWVFLSSQRGQMTRQNVNYLIQQAATRAGLGQVNPHMLRHSCGHALAEKGIDTRLMQDWLGHRDIRHTSWYSRTSAKRFDTVWG